MDDTDLTQEQLEQRIQSLQRLQQLRSMGADKNRAQTVSVGNAGCGTTEISLRGVDGSYLFAILHPAELVEHIHKCAANIGCHIHLQPRKDFASHREWRELTEEELARYNGWAPHPMLAENYHSIGGAHLPLGRPFQKPAKQEVPDGVAADQHENE